MKLKTLLFLSTALCAGSLIHAKDKYPAVMEYESAVVSFAKGASQLSSDDLMRLNKAVADAKAKGHIAKVEVAAWSDSEHPATGDLSKADRKLAESRLQSIKKDLKLDVGYMKYVHEYNMAENSNFLGRHLRSTEAELDAVFAKEKTGDLAREDFSLIKSEGAPSKAVVILKVRDKR